MKNSLSALFLVLVFALPLSASASEFLVIKKDKPLSCNGLAIKIDDNVWTKVTWRGFVVLIEENNDWQIFCGKNATNLPKKAWEKMTKPQKQAADATARQR